MKTIYKGIVSALTAAILLSLCLTPTVFATEEPSGGGDVPIESAVETELAEEKPEPSTATPSDALEKEETRQPDHSDHDGLVSPPTKPAVTPEPPEDGTATPSDAEEVEKDVELLMTTPSNAVEDTVSTGEELMEWLSGHKDTGGAVKLAGDISLGDFYYARDRGAEPVTIDTGTCSITANGYVYLQATSPLTIRGVGGEQGVLRSSGGGSLLHLNGLVLEAENGFAIFQEEGAGFITENTSVSGDAHYAKQPFVCEWKPALTVVERGKTLDAGMLPATLSARVNRQGQVTQFYEEVPVMWDAAGHEEDQELRLRFTVPGVFEDMASQDAPVCTVVYDDFPLTFLAVNVEKMAGNYGDSYRLSGTFSTPADRLPITVAQEYSFDGENWTLYDETTAVSPSSGFSISLFVGKEELERVPEFYIRLRWNDDKTVYYSNVLRFAADSFEANEEPGGNRGGGTDIVNPPEPPEPDPEPETTPPESSKPETAPPPELSDPTPSQPGNNGTDHESNGEGAVSPPESSGGSHSGGPSQVVTQKPDLQGGSSENETEPMFPVPESPSGPWPVSVPALSNETVVSSAVVGQETTSPSAEADTQPSRAPSAPVSEPPESPEHRKAVKDETPEDTIPVPSPETPSASDGAAAPSSGDRAEVLEEPEAEPGVPEPDVLPIVAGLATVAVSIGGAALYLHPKVWKRLLNKLRNRIRR